MGKIGIDQIFITFLKRIENIHGDILHGIKKNDPGFFGFGEAYFSIIQNNAIKAWKRHLQMTLNLIVPVGTVQFVFVDNEEKVREEIVGQHRYVRLTVPPGIWFGFKGLTNPYSLIMNIANIPHDPNEVERQDLEKIQFNWNIKK